jgi:hypothetical protein
VTNETPSASPAPMIDQSKPDTMKQILKGTTDTAAHTSG